MATNPVSTLNTDQRKTFDHQLRKMKAAGFFLPSKRKLSGNERHLIISYGGTGVAGLFGVKQLFEKVLPEEELRERVRFLAIDTDQNTRIQTETIKTPDGGTETIEVDSLNAAQFLHLKAAPAKSVALHPNPDPSMMAWLNPLLIQKIKDDKGGTYLDGNGASGIRQIGRLTLFPSETVSDIRRRILALLKELTNDNPFDLRISIITGIAGGTGSGTVVDMTYLIRSVVPENLKKRVRFHGYVMLPTTGDSDDQDKIDHGNTNGYAALKEINHFMTVAERHDSYSFDYGDGRTVTCSEPIFDACYLLDGVSSVMGFSKPRQQAVSVLSASLLDMITASLEVGKTVQSVDSFMSDKNTFRETMLSGKRTDEAMRDADYIYCALGHNEFAIPFNEIKAYVGTKLMEAMYEKFLNCTKVTQRHAEDFVDAVLEQRPAKPSEVKAAVESEINKDFTNPNRGPFFAINLLKRVAEEADIRKGKVVNIFGSGEQKIAILGSISKAASELNRESFNIYTALMNGLKDMMADQFDAVVKVKDGYTSYSFLPVSMGTAENINPIVGYLNGLVNQKAIQEMCKALTEEMVANRDNWMAMVQEDDTGKHNAPAAMRKFWNEKLDGMVRDSLEDFLVRYFTDEAKLKSKDPIQVAAQAIYDQMLGVHSLAQPMVELTDKGLTTDDLTGHTYLMVPASAKNLYRELEKIVKINNLPETHVCKSMADDRIVCYRHYSGIPAYKLAWVKTAEHVYEQKLFTAAGVGLHMSETVGGRQWKNIPNLLPKSSWEMLSTPYSCDRENDLAVQAEKLFEKARTLKLAVARETAFGGTLNIYYVDTLPSEFRPDENLYKQLENTPEGAVADAVRQQINEEAKACAGKLYKLVKNWRNSKNIVEDLRDAGVEFTSNRIYFSLTVMSKKAGEQRENWDETIAACLLRKMPSVVSDLDATELVIEHLKAMLDKSLSTKLLTTRFAQYLAAGMFTLNKEEAEWRFVDKYDESTVLAVLKYPVEERMAHYVLFKAFREDAEKIVAKMKSTFDAKVPDEEEGDPKTNRKLNRAFRDGAEEVLGEIRAWLKRDPLAGKEEAAEKRGYNPEGVYYFYEVLADELDEMSEEGYQAVVLPFEDTVKERPVKKRNGPVEY